jgi:hypothetical protein
MIEEADADADVEPGRVYESDLWKSQDEGVWV